MIKEIQNPQNDKVLSNYNGLKYSDYLTIFTALSFKGANSKRSYQRLAELIQRNIANLSGDENYSLKNSQVYCKLNTKFDDAESKLLHGEIKFNQQLKMLNPLLII